VQIAQLSVKSLTDHLAVSHDDSSDERIGTDPATPALGKFAGLPQMGFIRACQLRIHRTD